MQDQQYEILLKMRLQQDVDIKFKEFNNQIFNRFYIKKISNKEIFSRNIVICISGFTSEDENQNQKWIQMVKEYPELEIFVLEYRSYAEEELKQFGFHQINEYQKFSQLLGIVSMNSHVKALGISLFLAQIVQKNPFKEAQILAVQTGKWLGQFLSNKELFPNCTVSLVGFSLGTLVISSCIDYLEEKNYQNVLYEVLLMGGIVNVKEIDQYQKLLSVSGRLINCFTQNDQILKYLLGLVRLIEDSKPIGLNQISTTNNKLHNFDLSEFVDGHSSYMSNINKIIQKVDFNRDLQNIIDNYEYNK